MSIPELSIKRHVMAWMIGFIFILFGVIGYTRIPVQKMPDATLPVLSITIDLPGGSPSIIDQSITKRVEDAMNQIQGVKNISSVSKLGESQVQLNFEYGSNMQLATAQVQSQINRISNLFPANTKPPIIEYSAIGSAPIMLISFYGNKSLDTLADFLHDNVQKNVEGVDGVASAEIVGVGERTMHIVMDLNKMALRKITPSDITNALNEHHVNLPGGYIKDQRSRYVLDLNMEFHLPIDLEKLIVAQREGGPVFLGDVAKVDYTSGDNSGQALFNGRPAIGILVIKKSDANTLDIYKNVNDILKNKIKPMMPVGLNYSLIYEEATPIKHTVNDLERDIWLSIVTAGFIIFLFLASFRATAIVATAIPVSLLGVVAVMYFAGYSFNIITLLGVILLVGVVVDDAIIVLENIFREMELTGKTAMDVAGKASNQVVFAVLASTLTLIAIFLPVVFLKGEVSLYFKSFALVVTAGVLISLLVSITMTPMLCSRFLKQEHHTNRFTKRINAWLQGFEHFYSRRLVSTLNKPKSIILLFSLLILAAIPAYLFINKEFIPAEPQENVFRVQVNTPVGSSNEYVQSRISALAAILNKEDGVASYFSTVTDGGEGTVTVTLKPKHKRKLTQKQIVNDVTTKMQHIPGAYFLLESEDQGKQITFQLRGPDLTRLIELSENVSSTLQKVPQLSNIFIQMSDGQPGFKIELNRTLISQYGLSTHEVLNAISSISTDGLLVGYYNRDESSPRTEINLRAEPGQFRGELDLSKLSVRNNKGKLVNLDAVAKLVPDLSLAEINRNDLNYSINFSSIPTVSLGKATTLIQNALKNKLPQGYHIAMTGEAVSLQETLAQMKLAVFLILLLMYIVLASQFNSFIQPLIVMTAIPLAVVGGLLLLWTSTLSLNIYSMIGMLLLMGLVAKNSILLIDLTNHLREQGKSIREALLTACPIRMRPVMMTSLAIIFALLPAAILGAGSTARGLSVVIIGGMISSTLLSLIVVPAAYLLVETFLEKVKQRQPR